MRQEKTTTCIKKRAAARQKRREEGNIIIIIIHNIYYHNNHCQEEDKLANVVAKHSTTQLALVARALSSLLVPHVMLFVVVVVLVCVCVFPCLFVSHALWPFDTLARLTTYTSSLLFIILFAICFIILIYTHTFINTMDCHTNKKYSVFLLLQLLLMIYHSLNYLQCSIYEIEEY